MTLNFLNPFVFLFFKVFQEHNKIRTAGDGIRMIEQLHAASHIRISPAKYLTANFFDLFFMCIIVFHACEFLYDVCIRLFALIF